MKKVFAAMVIAIYMFVGAACMQPQHARAEGGVPFAAARDITKSCTLEVNKGKKSYLTDDKVKTYWGPWPKGSWLEVRLPDGESAGHMILEWFHEPEAYLIEEFDAGGTLLRERDQDCTYKGIHVTYDLLPQTKRILLTVKSDDERISSIKVYSEGALPDTVQSWLPPYEKADVMVVSTHQDDELIFLGGTIPYYTMARGVRVTVMYTVSCGRYRRMEALNGLWAAGVRHYPEFINLKDENISSIDETLKHWGGKEHVLELIVERIRRYRPEVIVAQDLNGEYGHNQHKLTSRMMQPAIEAAADASQFPESYRKYGAWQVKKLYLHLYEENQIRMDWETPLASLGGRSPLDMAKIAYDEHASQHKYYQVKSGGKYDNALFGLVYSAVGPDVARNDMLENIDLTTDDAAAEALPAAQTAAPTVVPTAVPTMAPTPVPATAAPLVVIETAAPLPPEEAAQETAAHTGTPQRRGAPAGLVWLAVGLGVVAAGSASGLLYMRQRRLRRLRAMRRKRRSAAAKKDASR